MFEPISFSIDKNHQVKAIPYVNTVLEQKKEEQYNKDEECIRAVLKEMCGCLCVQIDLLNALKVIGFSTRITRRVLKDYGASDSYVQHWNVQRSQKNNKLTYTPIPKL